MLERLHRQYRGTAAGKTGALVARVQSYGELQCYAAGAWADGSKHLHSLLLCREQDRGSHPLYRPPGDGGQLSVIISQYRRRVSTCVVRLKAQCLISRVVVISPAARGAAQRREAQGRVERQWREERKAQWMAGLGARSGRCHSLY